MEVSEKDVEFLKGTVLVDGKMMAPPTPNQSSTTMQRMTIYGNLSSSEADGFVWFLHRGVASLSTLKSSSTATFPVIGPAPDNTMNGCVFDLTFTPLTGVLWRVSPTHPSNVKVSPPNMGSQFSLCRIISGFCKIQSSTVTPGNLTLSGTIATAAITDIRDLRRVTQSSLSQSALAKKDVVYGLPIKTGTCSIVGDNIPTQYYQPDAELVYEQGKSGFARQVIQGVLPFGATPTQTNYFFVGFKDTMTAVDNALAPVPVESFYPGDQGWYDSFSFKIRMGRSASSPVIDEWATVSLAHIFVYADPATGNLIPQIVWDGAQQESMVVTGITDVMTSMTYKFETQQYLTMGQYAGTVIRFMNSSLASNLNYDVTVIADNIYEPGHVGPVRLSTWSHLNADSSIEIEGEMVFQAVPTQAITPFVSDKEVQMGPINASLLPALQALFSGDSEDFKHVYPLNEWEELRRKYGTEHDNTSRQISASLAETENPPVDELRSAGLFGSLFGSIAQLVKPVAKQVVGSLVQQGLQRLSQQGSQPEQAGAIGQFGLTAGSHLTQGQANTGNAWGEFGESAGQFGGNAWGEFGESAGKYRKKKRHYR